MRSLILTSGDHVGRERRLDVDSALSPRRRKYQERPEACLLCGLPAWWDGIRHVAQVVLDLVEGVVRAVRVTLERHRARCSDRKCLGGSWTIYEATGYPHRCFQLAVTAAAVAQVALRPEATLTAAAEQYQCDRRSVGRWVGWMALLAEPVELRRTVARLDPDGLPPPAGPRGLGLVPRAGTVLGLVERLVEVLRGRGVVLAPTTSGLTAFLGHRLRRFGEIFLLTKSSPPLLVATEGLAD